MDIRPTLKEIYWGEENNELIYNWEFLDIDKDIRIFYKKVMPDEGEFDKNGFDFVILTPQLRTKEYWALDWHCEVLYEGTALWDGIRHLWLGSQQTNNYGYCYYPDVELHCKALKALQSLEEKLCAEY